MVDLYRGSRCGWGVSYSLEHWGDWNLVNWLLSGAMAMLVVLAVKLHHTYRRLDALVKLILATQTREKH